MIVLGVGCGEPDVLATLLMAKPGPFDIIRSNAL